MIISLLHFRLNLSRSLLIYCQIDKWEALYTDVIIGFLTNLRSFVEGKLFKSFLINVKLFRVVSLSVSLEDSSIIQSLIFLITMLAHFLYTSSIETPSFSIIPIIVNNFSSPAITAECWRADALASYSTGDGIIFISGVISCFNSVSRAISFHSTSPFLSSKI